MTLDRGTWRSFKAISLAHTDGSANEHAALIIKAAAQHGLVATEGEDGLVDVGIFQGLDKPLKPFITARPVKTAFRAEREVVKYTTTTKVQMTLDRGTWRSFKGISLFHTGGSANEHAALIIKAAVQHGLVAAEGEDGLVDVAISPGQDKPLKPLIAAGPGKAALPPCPGRPNCVCSRDDALPRNRVESFGVAGSPVAAFARLKKIVASLPRATILTETDDSLHAVVRTRMGFPDDFRARLRPSGQAIDVRSASRYGWSDLGVNRRRVEMVRRMLEGGEVPGRR